ncbi:MAG: hypothetical protein U0905_11565 [Pirellulales bacterium]
MRIRYRHHTSLVCVAKLSIAMIVNVVADDHVVVQPAPSYSLGYAAGRLAQAYAKHPAAGPH